MLRVHVGRRKQSSQNIKRFLAAALAVLTIAGFLMLQNSSYTLNARSLTALAQGFHRAADFPVPPEEKKLSSAKTKAGAALKEGPCGPRKTCPKAHFSFRLVSGAANVVQPRICFDNKLLVGAVRKNAGEGINIAVVNGRTGKLIKMGHFNMYDGDVEPLIALLESVQQGFVVLMASYDEPSSKLNAAARKLIGALGSSAVQSLGYRDNWLFVGGRGVHSKYEKHIKHNDKLDKYEGWPEMIELEGCVPHYLA